MQLQVKLFARARDLAGSSIVSVELPTAATVAHLRTALHEQHSALRPIVPHLLVAIGTDYATDSTVIAEDAAVSCFPPVSGG